MQKGFAPVFIVFILAIIAIAGGVLVYTNLPAGRQGYSNNLTKDTNPVVTSQTPHPTKAPNSVDETRNTDQSVSEQKCNFPKKIVNDLLIEQLDTYSTRLPPENVYDFSNWPSLLDTKKIKARSGVFADYTSTEKYQDAGSISRSKMLQVIVTEYLGEHDEEFKFYQDLILNKSTLEFWKKQNEGVANPTFYEQKNILGLPVIVGLGPPVINSSVGNSSIVALVPTRPIIISFYFDPFQERAEGIFIDWLSKICSK